MAKVKGEQTSPKSIKYEEDQENADAADIYSDVLASQDASFEKLQKEVHKLRNEKILLIKRLDSLQKSYEKLQKEFEELESKYKTIAYNSSALLKTAQAEISRKDRMIQAVRKEKDDLLFRRSSSVRTSNRLRRSAVVSPRKLRTPIVSPRKYRTPLKEKTTSNQLKTPSEDSANARIKQDEGNENDYIKTDSKEIVQASLEHKNDAEPSVRKEDVKELSVQDNVEEVEQSDPVITYLPPALHGPITMYSKRLYKKMHGVSPQKMLAPVETLKSNVTHLPKNSEVSLPIAHKQVPVECSDQRHGVNALEMISPSHSLKSNISARNDIVKELHSSRVTDKHLPIKSAGQERTSPIDCQTPSLTSKCSDQRHGVNALEMISPSHSLKSNISSRNYIVKELHSSRVTDKHLPIKSAGQERTSPNDCKTPSLTSKLRLETQEFIKLGSSLKSCKTSPPQEVIIDLRKLPKEKCNSSDNLIKEILNTTLSNTYGLTSDRSRFTDTTTKNSELGAMHISVEDKDKTNVSSLKRDMNITSIKEVTKTHIKSPGLGIGSSNTEINLSKDLIHTSSHETSRVSNRSRPKANNNINKPVIAPVTFGKLVPHEPPKVIITKTGTPQTTLPVGEQSHESRKRKINSLSPTERVSLKTVPRNPSAVALISGKRNKLFNSLFGESPLKADKTPVPILDRKSPSPTHSLIFPNSPSLDSDDSEDLVIDTTAGSINSSPRLSVSEKKDEVEDVKINVPYQSLLRVNNRTSGKSILDNLNPLENVDNKTDPLKKQALKTQNTSDFNRSLSNYGLPDLSECYSLDNDVQSIKNPRLVNNESLNVKLDICLSSEKVSTIQSETKPTNVHVICKKEELSVPPRFVPSPPQLSSGVSGLNHSENSLLNIGDTMDLVSKLALTNVRDISPLRTPDKRNDIKTGMESQKSDPDNNLSGNTFSESSSPTGIAFGNIEKIVQILAVPNDKKTETSNSLSTIDLKGFTKHSALNTDFVMEKSNIPEQIPNKPPAVDSDGNKFSQPQNEFKRRRPVRRLDSHSKIENKLLKVNCNKENVESKVNSNLSVDSITNQRQVEKVRENLQALPPQTKGSVIRNENNEDSNLKLIISNAKEHMHLAPDLRNEIDKREQMYAQVASKPTQFLNPPLVKEIDTKAADNKLNPEVILPNIVSKSSNDLYRLIPIDDISTNSTKKASDVMLKQNRQLNTSLKSDLVQSTRISGEVHPNSILVPKEQKHSVTESKAENILSNLILKQTKESNPTQVPEINSITDVNKSTSETILSKLVSKSQDNLTDFLLEMVTTKSNQLSNSNLQKEIGTKNKVNIPIHKTVDSLTVNSQKIVPILSREDVLTKAKAVVRKLPIKNKLDIENKTFKRSSSIKVMAKPLQRVNYVKYDPLNKSETEVLQNNGCAPKKLVNTNKELEEIPHIARINQKVRISTFQGNKEQSSLHMHPPKEKTSPISTNNDKVSLDRPSKFLLPDASSTPSLDKKGVRIKRSREIITKNCEKVSRRSVSVDRVFIKRKRLSPINKQPRSKSNARCISIVNKPIPEKSVRRVLSRSPSPDRRSSNSDERVPNRSPSTLQKLKVQRHSRRSQSLSPGRRSLNSGKRMPSTSPSSLQKVKVQRHSRRSQSLSPGRRRRSNSGKRVPSRSPSPLQKVKVQQHSRSSRSLSSERRRSLNSGKRVPSTSPSPLQKVKVQRHSRRSQSLSPGRRRSNSGATVSSRSPSPLQKVKVQRHSRRSQSLSPCRRSSNSGKRVPSTSPSPVKKVKVQRHSRRSQSPSPGRRRSSNSGKRVLSRSPRPVQKIKFQRHSRRSQSVSPGRRSSQHNTRPTEDKIPVPRNSNRLRTNDQYHETIKNVPNHEKTRSSSNSLERTSRSKPNYVNKSMESDNPEPKVCRSSNLQSRRICNRSPIEEYRYRSRNRIRSPPHRSNSRNFRERSHSSDYRRYNKYANPRDRSRNQHERSRSRSPPRVHRARLEAGQIPSETEVLPYRNSKRRFSESEKYNESESADQGNKTCSQLHNDYSKIDHKEVIALRKEIELLKEIISETVDVSRNKEREKISKMQPTEIVCNTAVNSRSRSPHHSCHVKLASQTPEQPQIVQASGSQVRNEQINVNASSNLHSQNCSVLVSSQQQNPSFINKEENLTTPKNSVLTKTTHEVTSHVQVKRLKRKTRNLGDSEVHVVSATKINAFGL